MDMCDIMENKPTIRLENGRHPMVAIGTRIVIVIYKDTIRVYNFLVHDMPCKITIVIKAIQNSK